jgi:hypothetical protein
MTCTALTPTCLRRAPSSGPLEPTRTDEPHARGNSCDRALMHVFSRPCRFFCTLAASRHRQRSPSVRGALALAPAPPLPYLFPHPSPYGSRSRTLDRLPRRRDLPRLGHGPNSRTKTPGGPRGLPRPSDRPQSPPRRRARLPRPLPAPRQLQPRAAPLSSLKIELQIRIEVASLDRAGPRWRRRDGVRGEGRGVSS